MSVSLPVAMPSQLPMALLPSAAPSSEAPTAVQQNGSAELPATPTSPTTSLTTTTFADLIDELTQEVTQQTGGAQPTSVNPAAQWIPLNTRSVSHSTARTVAAPQKPAKPSSDDVITFLPIALVQTPPLVLSRAVSPAPAVAPGAPASTAAGEVEQTPQTQSDPPEALRLAPDDTVLQIHLRMPETDVPPPAAAPALQTPAPQPPVPEVAGMSAPQLSIPQVPTPQLHAPQATAPQVPARQAFSLQVADPPLPALQIAASPMPAPQVPAPAVGARGGFTQKEPLAPTAKPASTPELQPPDDALIQGIGGDVKQAGNQPDMRQGESRRLPQRANSPEHEEAPKAAPAQPFVETLSATHQMTVPAAAVVEKQAPPAAPAPPVPTTASAAPPEPEAPATPQQQVRSVALEFTPDGGHDVRLRVVERAGEVHVTLHSSDAGLTTKLRDGVQDLAGSLTNAGYDGEAWTPKDEGQPQQQQPQETPAPARRRSRSGESTEEFAGLFRNHAQEAK